MNRNELARVADASEFQDLLRDLRRSSSGAPDDVRNLVHRVASHPAVDQLRPWSLGSAPKYHYVFKLVPQWQAEKKGHVVLFGHVNLAMFF